MTRRYPLVLVSGQPRELADYDRIYNSGNVYRAATAPPTPVEGDLWCDTTNSTLRIYDGSAFVNIFASGNAVLSGDGIDVAANVVSVDLKTDGGLAFESTELALDLGAGSITGTLGFADGGTGQSSYLDGQLLVGNSATAGLSKATLTPGSNITITNGNGSIEIAATQNPVTAGEVGNVLEAGDHIAITNNNETGKLTISAPNVALLTEAIAMSIALG